MRRGLEAQQRPYNQYEPFSPVSLFAAQALPLAPPSIADSHTASCLEQQWQGWFARRSSAQARTKG
jgi:hypothetical protein